MRQRVTNTRIVGHVKMLPMVGVVNNTGTIMWDGQCAFLWTQNIVYLFVSEIIQLTGHQI